jgi:hypothetical protein
MASPITHFVEEVKKMKREERRKVHFVIAERGSEWAGSEQQKNIISALQT